MHFPVTEGETIVTIETIAAPDFDFLVITASGGIYAYNTSRDELVFLVQEADFNVQEIKIYSFRNYVVIVEEKGVKGIVLNVKEGRYVKRIIREDYRVENWSFSIAFYERASKTYLIHSRQWNGLDITCLETGELLTARDIIYEGEINYFDYFHSLLAVSPNQEYFVSNGWHWGPQDQITVYAIDAFLVKYELSHTSLNYDMPSGYNWNRPLCWINNTTLGIGYNKKEDEENRGDYDSEILFIDILKNEVVKRIPFNGFAFDKAYGEVSGNLYFDREKSCFIGLNKETGLLIADLDGNEMVRNSSLKNTSYSENKKMFLTTDFVQSTMEQLDLESVLGVMSGD